MIRALIDFLADIRAHRANCRFQSHRGDRT